MSAIARARLVVTLVAVLAAGVWWIIQQERNRGAAELRNEIREVDWHEAERIEQNVDDATRVIDLADDQRVLELLEETGGLRTDDYRGVR